MLDAGQVNALVEVVRNRGKNECLSPCISRMK